MLFPRTAADDKKEAASLWDSSPLMTYAASFLWAFYVSLEPQQERTFVNATVEGSEKGPCRRLHPKDFFINKVAISFNVASK